MAKILIIDDEIDFIFTYQTWFESEGFEVVTALDGGEGLEKAESVKPDLITLDLTMSPVSGYVAFDKLKLNPVTQNIPVIILTNVTRAGIYDEFMDKGAAAFCEKTDYSPKQLVEKIKEILGFIPLETATADKE
ncbi:MAG: response regulator [Candidatus Paceibacterota bacterium]|jgi:CheY-like chemotaxis protein